MVEKSNTFSGPVVDEHTHLLVDQVWLGYVLST